MTNLRLLTLSAVLLLPGLLHAQVPEHPDFATDVAPILRANCVSCHGPTKANNGLRMDQRSSAIKPITRRIVPGSSENSLVNLRLHPSPYGQQMPPTGELKPEQMAIIKRWIDQGAEWPDALANETPLPPVSPEAVALIQQLRVGNFAAVLKSATANPALLNARGPDGATPFMFAVLYAPMPTLARMIALGAKVNAHDDAGSTPLMWAASDLEKTRLLLKNDADVNAISGDYRTALMAAARKPGAAPTVRLLLAYGAKTNPNPHPGGQSSPLAEAATAPDADTMDVLLKHGAKITGDAELILGVSILQRCQRCVDLTVPLVTDKDVYTGTLQDVAYSGDARNIKMLLDHHADPRVADGFGRTALMYAVSTDAPNLETVRMLIAAGADVNAASKHQDSADAGLTVLDMVRRHGKTPTLDLLLASGAKTSADVLLVWHPRKTALAQPDIRAAIQATIPHLQRSDFNFSARSGCISCHNNSLTAMTVSMTRKQGFRIDEKVAAGQVLVNVDYIAKARDQILQNFTAPVGEYFGSGVLAYQLIGLQGEGYKPDLNTDAAVIYLLAHQNVEGDWRYPVADSREPLCLNFIGQTAQSMRALQLYRSGPLAPQETVAIQHAAAWLANAKSANNDDRGWRLLGLAWAANNKPALAVAMKELLATQRADGSFADLPTMDSTAYATGKSLFALATAGLPVTSPAYQRGVAWLLAHQEEDGSWLVQTRALAFQPKFDSEFPHGDNQWISAAGTNWAAMALALALPKTPANLLATR